MKIFNNSINLIVKFYSDTIDHLPTSNYSFRKIVRFFKVADGPSLLNFNCWTCTLYRLTNVCVKWYKLVTMRVFSINYFVYAMRHLDILSDLIEFCF